MIMISLYTFHQDYTNLRHYFQFSIMISIFTYTFHLDYAHLPSRALAEPIWAQLESSWAYLEPIRVHFKPIWV